MIKKQILIATGGTGGHVFPAFSLASYLLKKNYKVKLISDKRGLNYLSDCKNLNLIKISSSPLIRKNIFIFLFSSSIIFYSIIRSLFYLLFNRPKIIFGMGGYSSFPICFAAFILKIKFVIYENNLILGKANKFLLPFAKKIFVSYQNLEGISENYKNKIITIGNLVREDIIKKRICYDEEDKFNQLKILILGGSQGAKVFAEQLPLIFEKLYKDYEKYHSLLRTSMCFL